MYKRQVSGTTLTDDDVDFDSVLTDGTTYILEITSGALSGTIQEVGWNSPSITNDIVTGDDLGSDGLAAADTYQIRESASLFSVFGEDNSAGLLEDTNITEADVVWLVNPSGAFDRYYYSPGGGFGGGVEGWRDSNGTIISDISMVYADSFFVQSRSTEDVDLVITGAVKLTGTSFALDSGFNYISPTFPVGSNLENAGLEDSLTADTNITAADVVWIPNEAGSYERYYYNPGGGFGGGSASWRDANNDVVVASDILLTSGVIIQRRGVAINLDIDAPDEYSSL